MSDSFPLDPVALLRVVNYLNVGVYVTDLDRRIVLWNRKAEEMTGYRAADVVGHACHDDLLQHTDKDGHNLCAGSLCPLYRSMKLDQESHEPIMVYAKRADGTRIAVGVTTAPLHDAAGKVVGGVEVFQDMTESVRDMEFAKRIQEHMLPQSLPQSETLRFQAKYYPHGLIGGDFYDVWTIDQDRFGFLIADVRGHGVSGALYTMLLRALRQSLHASPVNPGAALSELNRQLCAVVVEDSFATAIYGVADAATRSIAYSNAGHPPPLHYIAWSKSTLPLESHGLPLGVNEVEEYPTSGITLDDGDLLLCYSDGISEVRDKGDAMLGTKGLAAMLCEEIPAGADDLLERLYQKIMAKYWLEDNVVLLSIGRVDGA